MPAIRSLISNIPTPKETRNSPWRSGIRLPRSQTPTTLGGPRTVLLPSMLLPLPKAVPTRFWYFPTGTGGGGGGGSGLGAVSFTEALAAHGWIVACPDHHDKYSAVRIRTGPQDGFDGWGFIKNGKEIASSGPDDRGKYLFRLDEMRIALDGMLASDLFGPVIDRDRIALGGHSFGGFTALGLSGTVKDRRDPRIKALLLFSTGAGGYLYTEPGFCCSCYVWECVLLRTNQLIIVGGPSAVGKSTLLERIKKGDEQQICSQLDIRQPSSCLYCDAMHLHKICQPFVDQLVLHYDILYQYSPRYGFKYLPDIICRSDDVCVLTLLTSSEVLFCRTAPRLKKAMFSFMCSPRKSAGKRLFYQWRTRKFYSSDRKLFRQYVKWDRFLEAYGVAKHFVLNSTNSDYTMLRPYESNEIKSLAR